MWVVKTQRSRADVSASSIDSPAATALRGELERGQRGVALVEMQHPGLDPERTERAERADPEQPVLPEPRQGISLVEARRDPAVDGVVLVELRVEQVERDAADLGAPDVERDLALEEREREPERGAVGARHLDGRQVLRDDLGPVLVLEPGAIDPLLEVALSVEQPDADHGHGEVARLLEDVARERAEPSGVDGQRGVDAELGADEDDRPAEPVDRRLGACPVLLENSRQPRDPLADRLVSCGCLGCVRREILELANRVPAVDLPGVRVERAEERGPVRIPRPAIVERYPGERRQLGGQAPRELCRALVRLARAGQRGDVDHAGRAHGSSS